MVKIHGYCQVVSLYVPKTERRVENAMNGGHEMDWVRACKESPESRVMTKSDFSEAGPFNEMVVMGVLAVRLQGLNKELDWDGEKYGISPTLSDDDKVRLTISDNFTIVDGDPKFDRPNITLNAKQFAAEMVKHTYRKGFELPAMPSV